MKKIFLVLLLLLLLLFLLLLLLLLLFLNALSCRIDNFDRTILFHHMTNLSQTSNSVWVCMFVCVCVCVYVYACICLVCVVCACICAVFMASNINANQFGLTANADGFGSNGLLTPTFPFKWEGMLPFPFTVVTGVPVYRLQLGRGSIDAENQKWYGPTDGRTDGRPI